MKPLLAKELPNFVSRFGNFVDAEIRSINIISPTVMSVTIGCQDSARGFDWLSINLECSNVVDARLIDEKKLSLIDMSDGASLLHEDGNFAFGIGNHDNHSSLKNATSYIVSSTIKYEEDLF